MGRPDFWHSPTVRRALRTLEQRAPCSVLELSQAAHISRDWAGQIVRRLKREGCVYVAAWRRYAGPQIDGHHGGGDTPLYRIGDAPDAPRPPRTPAADACHRYRARLKETYGTAIATKRIKSRRQGGADRLVVDGQTIYQRRAS
jgi:hypothetical protein